MVYHTVNIIEMTTAYTFVMQETYLLLTTKNNFLSTKVNQKQIRTHSFCTPSAVQVNGSFNKFHGYLLPAGENQHSRISGATLKSTG